MIIQHNLAAMNVSRSLGTITKSQMRLSETLSSGYRINRAADDAAGLSISEKMRRQIRGLKQALANAQDGISAIQTAEGALTETHDMLQRMNELAVKAANGTLSEDDRTYIQNEVDQLIAEIDRISGTTKFNESGLLKGNPSGDYQTMSGTGLSAGDTNTIELDGETVTILNQTLAAKTDSESDDEYLAKKLKFANDISKEGYKSDSANVAGAVIDEDGNLLITAKKDDLNLELHVGADSDAANKINVKIASMDAASLGINNLRVDGPTGTRATAAIDTVKEAVRRVSMQRSSLGAYQNRLEHTINNLDNVIENTEAAESAIRDADMVKAMVEYAKNNILIQVSQAMLAQANQSNQGVLALLQ